MIIFSACKPNVPEIQKDEIIGIWDCLSGCEAEQYEFYQSDEEYGFYIYSGRRMYRSGSWDLIKNQLTLYYEDEDTASYPVALINDTLRFGADEMVFVAFIPDTSETIEEPGELENPAEGLSSLDFTDPEPAEFIWFVPVDSSSIEQVTIEGMMVQTTVELKGDYSPIGETTKIITKHLEMLGYMPDMTNVTEIVDGYIREDCVVLIRPVADFENPVGEAIIQVFYGELPQH